jgi:hypothetical protein
LIVIDASVMATLVGDDTRLSRAPGSRCRVEVLAT